MKVICLTAFLISISILASAQVNIVTPEFSLPEISNSKSKIIGQTNMGNIYALPIDNMPCVVAFTPYRALMPILNTPLVSPGIPNSFPKQNLLKTTTSDYNFLKPDKAPSKNLMLDLIRKNKHFK